MKERRTKERATVPVRVDRELLEVANDLLVKCASGSYQRSRGPSRVALVEFAVQHLLRSFGGELMEDVRDTLHVDIFRTMESMLNDAAEAGALCKRIKLSVGRETGGRPRVRWAFGDPLEPAGEASVELTTTTAHAVLLPVATFAVDFTE